MSSNHNRPTSPHHPAGRDKPKRHLKTKPALAVMAVLLAGNLLWFIAYLIPNGAAGEVKASSEEVASVDGSPITREEWMAAMEERAGRETLRTLVNEKVMTTAAEKYDINVTDEEIDLELAMQRSAREGTEETEYAEGDEHLRDTVRTRLILEKVLTKDVIIEEAAVRNFYEENQSLYNVKDAYRTRGITVNTQSEAEDAIAELENGSSFEALARERSLDAATGSLGGDLGFITPDESAVDKAIAAVVPSLGEGDWSEPIALSNGQYAIVMVTDIAEGRTFSLEEVEGHIARELALEQLPQSVTPEVFWKEFNAEWFYGE